MVLDDQAPFNGVPRKLGCYEGTGAAQDSVRYQEIWDLHSILLLEHFQFAHPFGSVRRYAEMLVKFSREYFNAKWIDNSMTAFGCLPDLYKKRMTWLDPFRLGVLVAIMMNDQEGVHEITSWINGEFSRDELDYTQADIDYYVVLGKYLNQGVLQKFLIDSIKNRRRKRPKYLTEMLEALAQKDSKRFAAFFIEYHKLFDKNECDKDAFLLFKNVNINGSILWNLAKLRGLEIPEFSENIMDRIITPQSIGLDE